VGFLTIVAKAGSTAKELIVAQSFGRGDALDAFLIAFLLPSFVVSLVMHSLGVALIPTFVEIRQKQGDEAAQRLFSSMMLLSLLVLVAVVILLGLLAPYYLPYLGSGFPTAKLRLTRELLYMLLPFVFFSGIATYASYILNAGEKFALSSLTPLVTPLAVILFILLGPGSWGPFSLAAGTVVGSFCEAALLICTLRIYGMRLTLRWNGLDSGVRSVLGQYTPMLAGSFLMGATTVVDQSMAAMLHGGSVAALGYANKVVTPFAGIGALALSTAVLPYFSKMVADKDLQGCRHTLKRYSTLVALVTVPTTLALIFFSEPLVRLLFQRGSFTSADTRLVSLVQICYSIQIPFYIWGMLFVRFLSSMRRNDVLMYGAVISLLLDVSLNLALMKVWGVAGIALSTSLVYGASFIYLSLCSIKLLAQERSTALAALQQQTIRQMKIEQLNGPQSHTS
jgi:putative peptidoglycan lipid II flippase